MSNWIDEHSEKFSTWIGAAQHQDKMNAWPKWAKFLHKLLIAYRCPACIEWKKMHMPVKGKG